MPIGFNTPGVSVTEIASPSLVPAVASPSFTCLVGTATGKQAATEYVTITTSPVTLANPGVDTSSVVVKLLSTLQTINPGGYTVVQSSDPNPSITGDEIYTIALNTVPTAPSVADSGNAGNPTGTYVYAISFVRSGSNETGVGANSGSVTVSGHTVSVSSIPVGPGGTTARNIYRMRTSAGGDNLLHFVAQIADNSTTTYTDNLTNLTVEAAAQPQTALPSGSTVIVAYNYTDTDYFEPTLFNDFSDIVTKYGPPFDGNGNISSQLTFGAYLVLANGGNEVVLVATKSSGATDFQTALDSLKNEPDVTLIVPITATTAILTATQAHCDSMNTQGFFRMCALGQDSSGTPIAQATLQAAAQGYNDQATILVSPPSFKILNQVTGNLTAVGSQYMACAIAGMMAARDPWVPLTRKAVAGFADRNEKRTESQEIADEASGLCVIQLKGNILRVRHGITTAVGNVNTQEISVVRAKYEMARRLREELDHVIGIAAPLDELPLIVGSVIEGVLARLILVGLITSFGNLNVRSLSTDPTTVEARFEYIPIYPLNNIQVLFMINTQNGIFSVQAG